MFLKAVCMFTGLRAWHVFFHLTQQPHEVGATGSLISRVRELWLPGPWSRGRSHSWHTVKPGLDATGHLGFAFNSVFYCPF